MNSTRKKRPLLMFLRREDETFHSIKKGRLSDTGDSEKTLIKDKEY